MTVRSILETKGRDVVVIASADTLSQAVAMLNKHKIGALVVCDEAGHIEGILSERDVVRALAAQESQAMSKSVAEVMTSKVQVCHEHHTINQVMKIMTRSRFRHSRWRKAASLWESFQSVTL
ncbi:hypothetical protein C064_01150 [Brucella suis 63/252]|uniref:CBS domain-containing protein n=1 Tax=Brucella suis TaxID=29461 RepID=A0AAU8QIN0_BRUSS|nr:CBS domain-containing protein [Brucella canis HSK A52141]AHZ81490.1 hypothetical protein DA85_06015 [Brucella canis]AIJ70217.1 hypothetical protein DK67_1041 [Brucella suis bv. 3 str. 686]AIJ98596.1 hypothetical protein DO76_1731 [Brucella suis]ALY31936.1 hypothetical protein AWH03_08465 [Brucella suis 019]EEW90821.1 CBS domain-containing protein [Brucella suis bv. 4 str. 40]ENQ57689.1 hypothetical protein C969_01153 [Brucella canis CNGB 1172]ENQ60329.1 hypothetical protein C979_00682 [Br